MGTVDTRLTPYGIDWETTGYATGYSRGFAFNLFGNIAYEIVFSSFPTGATHVRCLAAHWSSGYQLFRDTFLASAGNDSLSAADQYDLTSTLQGAWSITKPETGKLKISKSAGTYNGSMNATIFIDGAAGVELSSVTTV